MTDPAARAAFFAFVASRQMDERRRDIATIDAVLAWARDPIPGPPGSVTVHGDGSPTVDLGESPEAFDLRANILRMGAVNAGRP